MTILSNRYDFTLIFDVTNGNPNGDPDAGNLPRMDPDTNKGLVSDVCLKRKIRNYVELARHGQEGFHIYVEEGAILNEKHREASEALGPTDIKADTPKPKNKSEEEKREIKRRCDFMCENFFDVRTFGAVMSTGDIKCGTVKGPVQMSFATSVEPIMPLEIAITRAAATKEKPGEGKNEDKPSETGKMGRKHIVPYGLYVAHGFISAKFAERTGFSESDLDLVWEALTAMFEHDRSAARGEMVTRKLIAFRHDCALGNAPAHALFDRVRIGRDIDGEFRSLDDKGLGNQLPARKFSDYIIEIDHADCPSGVEIIEL